ncbi:hypothetical protein VTL71DRAFT_2707 [Oculimacula yallundae]|uniref:Transposase n=1 Tax=Oculimacula yallundae TaxID=86028 RepID=A0ABR4CB03_9HELO
MGPKNHGKRLSIIYDPFREALSKEVITKDQEKIDYEKVPVKGSENPICIYLDIGEGQTKTKSLLARVDIGQLGWQEWLHRHLGHTQEIWVKGRVPPPSVRERVSWPRTGPSGCGLEPPHLRHYPASAL